jgi:hypothetical protein
MKAVSSPRSGRSISVHQQQPLLAPVPLVDREAAALRLVASARERRRLAR